MLLEHHGQTHESAYGDSSKNPQEAVFAMNICLLN